MVDVRGDVLRPPHGTTPAAVKSNIKSEMRSFKSNENIHKKEGGSYYVVSANKALSVTGLSPPLSIFILTVPRRCFCCGSLLLLVLAVRIYTLVQLLC